MLPKLSQKMIHEKVNKIGLSFYPDLLLKREKCADVLTKLNEEHPDIFQSISQLNPGVFALNRSIPGMQKPEHSLIITPKGCTLTISDPEFQRDEEIKRITLSTVSALRDVFPIRRVPRVGRIVELVLKWDEGSNPHDWMKENFTVFDSDDDISELNFRFLYRSSGMNINTILTPVRHKKTQNWGLQVICDVNNIDVSSDVSNDMIGAIIDFSTLYFPDRTFEIMNRHIK